MSCACSVHFQIWVLTFKHSDLKISTATKDVPPPARKSPQKTSTDTSVARQAPESSAKVRVLVFARLLTSCVGICICKIEPKTLKQT
jgi:hypothetical protein